MSCHQDLLKVLNSDSGSSWRPLKRCQLQTKPRNDAITIPLIAYELLCDRVVADGGPRACSGASSVVYFFVDGDGDDSWRCQIGARVLEGGRRGWRGSGRPRRGAHLVEPPSLLQRDPPREGPEPGHDLRPDPRVPVQRDPPRIVVGGPVRVRQDQARGPGIRAVGRDGVREHCLHPERPHQADKLQV